MIETLSALDYTRYKKYCAKWSNLDHEKIFMYYYLSKGFSESAIQNAWNELETCAEQIHRLLTFRVVYANRETCHIAYASDNGDALYFLDYVAHILAGCPYNCEHFTTGKHKYLSGVMKSVANGLHTLGLLTDEVYHDIKDTTYYRTYNFL